MKRALKNKLKAVIENTTSGEDAPVEELNMNDPRESRRARTRTAMIGLALSMGATSLFVTRQNDQALAAEPVGNQNTASTFSAVPDTEVNFVPTNLLESQNTASVVTNKSVVEPTAVSQVSGLGTNWQVATNGVQVPTPYKVSVPQQLQAVPGVTIPSVNTNVQANSKLPETLANAKKSYNVALNQTAIQTVANPEVAVSSETEAKVDAQLKAQQEFALHRLQAKSNRLKDSLANFRGADTKQSIEVAANIEAQPIASSESTQPESTQTSPTANLVSRLKQKTNVASAAAPTSILTPAPASGTLPKADSSYEVKSGDTLASIARNNSTSVTELLKVNNLSNANRLTVKQKLTIPTSQANVAVNLNTQETPSIASSTTSPVNPVNTNVVANNQAPIQNFPTSVNLNGVGGDMPVPKAFADVQIAKSQPGAKVKRKNAYVRNLQDEIERLRERYRAQQSGNLNTPVVVPVVPQNNTSSVPIQVPTASRTPVSVPIPVYGRQQTNPQARPSVSAKEPINPDFQNNGVSIPVPRAGQDSYGSLGNMRGVKVSPQFPPLASVDKYLPSTVEGNTPVGTGDMPGGQNSAFIWPAKGVLTSGYGWRWGRMHRGIDVAGPVGTPIYAAADGIVEKSGWNNGGYGYLVEIRHSDGTMTRYGHNSKLLVQQGQPVRQGQHKKK